MTFGTYLNPFSNPFMKILVGHPSDAHQVSAKPLAGQPARHIGGSWWFFKFGLGVQLAGWDKGLAGKQMLAEPASKVVGSPLPWRAGGLPEETPCCRYCAHLE